jgi:hypothetical protein
MMVYELLKRGFEESSSFEEVFAKPIIYGDYLRPGYSAEDRRYEQVNSGYKIYQYKLQVHILICPKCLSIVKLFIVVNALLS